MTFAELLDQFGRVAIAGGPRTGKSTVASQAADRLVIHTDDWQSSPWADAPLLINAACVGRKFVVEGIQVGRCLRKGLEIDAVIWLDKPLLELAKGQAAMRKGCETIFRDWLATGHEGQPVFAGALDGAGQFQFAGWPG